MAACWNNKHHAAIIVTLLAFLAPTACHGGGGGGGLLIDIPIICSRGWVRPITILRPFVGLITICPPGSSGTPPPSPSPPPPPPTGAGLYPDYYNNSCPNAEAIVRKVVEKAIASQGAGVAAGLIRLEFHDCFVNGCDASVLLTTTASGNNDTEREGTPNKDSLRGFDVVDQIKAELEYACPGKVSCADILAYAARDAARNVSRGNIEYSVPGGRLDGRESFASQTESLPGPFSNLTTLEAMFAAQGLNATDMTLLSGAHSIGLARCAFASNHTRMNTTFGDDLKKECPNTNGQNRVNQDYATPDVLDSQYYKNIVDDTVLFDSDAALNSSADTRALVQRYKLNSNRQWEKDFGEAMVKMSKINTKTKAVEGVVEIRRQCWTINR